MDGFKHANAVAVDLEQATGLKPGVGFNWHNGRLVRVTVTFPKLYDAKPVRELADVVRTSVRKQFKQAPEDIELGFSLGATAPDTSAQADNRVNRRASHDNLEFKPRPFHPAPGLRGVPADAGR